MKKTSILALFLVLIVLSPQPNARELFQVEVDRSVTVSLSATDINIIFEAASHIFSEARISIKFILDDTLLSVGTLRNDDDMRNALKKTRNHKSMLHVILADSHTAGWFGLTQYNSPAGWYPKQSDLDKTGSFIFVDNIKESSELDELSSDYTDTLVTFGELLTKVLVHELGHQFGLNHPEYMDDMYSLMHQGLRVSMINGPNNEGPRFSEKDMRYIDTEFALTLDRTRAYYANNIDDDFEIDFLYMRWKHHMNKLENKAYKIYWENTRFSFDCPVRK